jgi:hypothetical protein
MKELVVMETKKTNRSAATVALIASAADLGYVARTSFGTAVASAAKLVPSTYLATAYDKAGKLTETGKRFAPVIRDFGEQYKAGHVVAYLEPHYGSKRWGNMERAQRVESAIEIMGKAEPTSERSNRRTELEHKAVKAAQSAWSHLKGEAGLKPQTASKTNRKGASKRRAVGDEKAVPAARLMAPHFVAPIDAVKFYENLAADLLKAVNSNAMATPIALKSAVQDFRAAVRKAATELKAGAKRTAAAKATRGTVSAATIAARTQNPRPTATVN